MPPLYIHIQGLNHPLTSGVKVHLSCSTAGARPVPQIIWTKGTQVMQGASQTVCYSSQSLSISHESNSRLTLIHRHLQTATSQHQISFIYQHPKTMAKSLHARCLLKRKTMHQRCPLKIHEIWTLNVSTPQCTFGGSCWFPLVIQFVFLAAHNIIRCSNSNFIIGIKFGSEKPRQRHRCLLGMPHPSQSTDKED